MNPDLPSGASLPTSAVAATPARRAVHIALAILGVSIAAQLALPIPGTPVPVTLQDLAVLVVGVLLGPIAGATALAGYLSLGAMGAPVFSNGHSGIAWLMGPSGGYLLAYPAAAWVMGMAALHAPPRAELNRRGILRVGLILAGALAAQALIFGGGIAQLLLLTGQDLGTAVQLGVLPFLPGIIFKTGLLITFVITVDRLGPAAE